MQNKVLVVENDDASMRLLKRVIGKAKLQAVCANSLSQAKYIFSSSAPESYLCAVVDYSLPDAPEGEAIDYAIQSFLPVIAITGFLDGGVREKVLNKEVVDYIPKENAQVYEYLSRLLARLEKNRQVGVLVVESSRLDRYQMVSLLRRHNFVTYQAADAEQGMAELRAHPQVKLVITEGQIANSNGLGMIAQIRKTYSADELSIIGVSATASSALSARFIKSGANDYLTKPYCHEEFFCRVLQNVEHIEHIEAIHRAANLDFLTRLPNRRHFFSEVNNQLKRQPAKMCLALIDLDRFKSINDSYGHEGGDLVLQQVAKALARHFAEYCVARFGGEEFCVFLPEVALTDAARLLENFRQETATTPMCCDGKTFYCTLSIGLTARYDGKIESMLRRADKHLYQAKQQGRNCLVKD